MYLKAYKSIETELALPVYQRVDASKLLTELRDTMSKISDISPAIPNNIISTYKVNAKNYKTSQPILANGLDPILIFKDPEEEKHRAKVSFVSNEVVKQTDARVGDNKQELFKKSVLPTKK